jgi:glycosyltransferase involved in cell wall biosynthesis
MFFIRNILRESGYVSEIYCVHVEPRYADEILSFDDYEDDPTNLILVHYSLGTYHDSWISQLRSFRVLVYHNITPYYFFPPDSELRRLADSGRRQLAQWAKDRHFTGAIADSEFNAEELAAWGYSPVEPIGLLVDLDRIRNHAWNTGVAGEIQGPRNLLFVGRLCTHKGQLGLVRMMGCLGAIMDLPVRLLLAGAAVADAYETDVRNAITRLGLEGKVAILGKREDEDIYALYRSADLYVSLSQHEGFGMPLVEAMAFDLPVLAFAAGSVAATLGPGGLVLENATPATMAAAAKLILQEPGLRRQIIAGQRRSLARYERPVLIGAFQRFLRRLDFDVAFHSAPRAIPAARQQWTLEGPFDTSYSLAIVNRELARALARAGETVALLSRDGPGPYPPDRGFLDANPDIAAMVERGRAGTFPDLCLRNQYPPHVADMRGGLRVLANYAWEESGFPAGWVDEFNASLDLVTVTSRYVAKVLRDNGVHVPIHVVGNAVDHILAGPAEPPALREGRRRFRFLHVSSGFPRKGTDVLLAAWGAAFTRDDAAELVIKTFPNIHNRVGDELAGLRAAHPDAAPVTLIDVDLDPAALRALYDSADALVCPSRGEGFGLPLAEAMALGIPVITTAHGGQSDFCTDETAWLCDYRFAYAGTHLSGPGSVWAEPDPGSLVQALRQVFAATAEERARRADAGRARILSHYTWDQVAGRTREAIAQVRRSPSAAGLRLPVIGLVSTWNCRCGIAAYAQSLFGSIEAERLHVFASRVAETLRPDEAFVRRCWAADREDTLDELFEAICAAGVEAVVLQFNFGFFRLAALQLLLDRLHQRGTPVFIMMHATMDVVRPDLTIRLAEIRPALARVSRLLVHSVHDLNRLKFGGLVDNVTLFPMGLPEPFGGDRAAVRRSLGLAGKPVIASFGYLLPHKGLPELIRAFARLGEKIPDAHLLMLNALYPVGESDAELRACRQKISELGIRDRVTLVSEFLDEADVLAHLAAADVIVYPYQNTQESASAAVKMGLGSLTPVAVTPLPIFADIATVSHVLPGTTPADIEAGLAELLADRAARSGLAERQKAWVAAHAWAKLSARLDGLIRGELLAGRSALGSG